MTNVFTRPVGDSEQSPEQERVEMIQIYGRERGVEDQENIVDSESEYSYVCDEVS